MNLVSILLSIWNIWRKKIEILLPSKYLNFILIRQLNTAVDLIKRSGEINPSLSEPLPLRDCEDGKSRSIPMEEKSKKDTKKKVSFMGGNLDPVTSIFYKEEEVVISGTNCY